MRKRSKIYNYKVATFKGDIPKPKKNEIVIIPSDNRLLEIPPFINEEKLPSWWKNLPVNKMSLRRCSGTYDYLQYGLTIPMWTDVTVRPNAAGNQFEYQLSNFGDEYQFRVEGFLPESASGCPFGEGRNERIVSYPKFVSPWRYITPKGISSMILPVLHEPNPNYIVMPGIVDTDFYHVIQIVITVLTDKEFVIPAGTPMQHIIPIRRTENFKKIIFGNQSMYKFHIGNGMGRGNVETPDNSQLYRKLKLEKDAEPEKVKKWYSLKK